MLHAASCACGDIKNATVAYDCLMLWNKCAYWKGVPKKSGHLSFKGGGPTSDWPLWVCCGSQSALDDGLRWAETALESFLLDTLSRPSLNLPCSTPPPPLANVGE